MELLGKRVPSRQSSFDINLLPLNLSDGRNIGDLSGLYLFNAPKKAESSRQSDILIILFHTDNVSIPEPRMRNWANILAENYFIARGSFTMGITAAVKKLSAYLEKEAKGQIFPVIFMNAAVIRGRSLMIAHAGPVHSTVISSDHVQNFNNDSCLPIQLKNNELHFFTTEVHSEDIILLCPKVPNDWTNAAIMEVTGDSPLNAIRFLLDRSGGNLQAAVIQLKAGKGQISFRRKTSITADVQPGNREDGFGKGTAPAGDPAVSENYSVSTASKTGRPLFRQRRSTELFNSEDFRDSYFRGEDTAEPEPVREEETDQPVSLTGEQELPGSEKLPYDFDSIGQTPEPVIKQSSQQKRSYSDDTNRKKSNGTPSKRTNRSGEKFNLNRFLMILACGILIPVIVVSVLFFIYSGRSKDQLHRDYLSLAVGTAQKALFENEDKREQEALWAEVLDYTEKALSFSKSPASNDLKKEAMMQMDAINGGISTVYNYANQTKLPQGINITEIAGAGQFTYALDSTSGSVLRFSASGSGLALDSNFSCTPGSYTELGNDENQIKVGALVDFILLPAGNPHNFVLAGVDKDANMLFCSAFASNRAETLPKPTGKFDIKAITYSNNAMYVLD
ncbi:MAG: hypothetical protein IKP86_04695, partial [Anaerolineaceae bacterium]|nr:hypothetical protein [Anaerolineaceae bacterium]